jgi:hypothetical protein
MKAEFIPYDERGIQNGKPAASFFAAFRPGNVFGMA